MTRRILFHVADPDIGVDEMAAAAGVLRSGRVTMGETTRAFEDAFAARVGSAYAVAVSSGTAALHLAMACEGLKPGDRVIVPDFTFIATANAVRYCGAEPVFVDVDATWGMDPVRVAEAIDDRTVGIVPVHAYGYACDNWELLRLASDRGLWMIEDAAEALGGDLMGRALGTFGHAGVFSFYGNKTLTTGEGGMLVTDDPGLAARARLLRGQGQGPERYSHVALGFNYRMTDLQAALGLAQLSRLDASLERRREIMARYALNLADRVAIPEPRPESAQAPWLFTCLLPAGTDRARFMSDLERCGIETRPTFVPMHRQPFDRRDGDFPISEEVSAMGVSLPTHVALSDRDVDFVSEMALGALDRQERKG